MHHEINNKDITVVIQGPVQTLSDRSQEEGITLKCFRSVKKHLPESKIILSTWPKQDLSKLEYDELIINEDPGPNIAGYFKNGEPNKQNYNRQIITSLNGLKHVKTPFAMKLRADNYLTGTQFKDLFIRYKKRSNEYKIFKEHVVVNNTFTREFSRGLPVAFHACDFFYFGLTEDLVNIWDLHFFKDLVFNKKEKGFKQYYGAPFFSLDATQDFWISCLNKHITPKINLKHGNDISNNALEISDKIFANNLIIGSPDNISLGLTVKFSGKKQRASKKITQLTFISHKKWQILYQRYCDPSFNIPDKFIFLLHNSLARLFKLSPRTLGSLFRLSRNWILYKLVLLTR